MRRLTWLLCALMCLGACTAQADAAICLSRENAPYWHLDADCRFAETEWLESDIISTQTRQIPVGEAEAEGQKPCPGCATAFPPMFSGDFPEWQHDVTPWGYEDGGMVMVDGWPRGAAELPREILAQWGAPSDKLNELFPEAWDEATGASVDPDYPDDYAGLYMNACGGVTILLVDPTPERVAGWRDMLEGEFWVLSARNGWNALQALMRDIETRFMGADVRLGQMGEPRYYHITSLSVNVVANVLEVGVDPDFFDEGVARMRSVLSDAGHDEPGMIRFVPADYPEWL